MVYNHISKTLWFVRLSLCMYIYYLFCFHFLDVQVSHLLSNRRSKRYTNQKIISSFIVIFITIFIIELFCHSTKMASDQTIFNCDVDFQQFSLGYFKSKRCILDSICEDLDISVIKDVFIAHSKCTSYVQFSTTNAKFRT